MKVVALIPARSGSVRVPGKNVYVLAGHPIIAYAIAGAQESGVFSDVVVSTDSTEIAEVALRYGADVPGLRPAEFATATSPDVEWVAQTMKSRDDDAFAILRPTSPFRTAETIRRALERFVELSEDGVDSIRAVQRVRQHPGKMWVLDGKVMRPVLDQGDGPVPYHSTQAAGLPEVWVQNSSLEIAWTRVLARNPPTIAGELVAPFFTADHEGFSIDYPEDLEEAKRLVSAGGVALSRPVFVEGR